MGHHPVRVLVAVRPSLADTLATSLRRSAIEVETAEVLDRERAAAADVVAVERGVGDWTQALGLPCRVLVLAPDADAALVCALLVEGADDVLARTDRPQEAVARIRALERRRGRPAWQRATSGDAEGQAPASGPVLADGPVQVDDVVLDRARRTVTCGGRPVDLTRRQFDLLECLMANAGMVVTRTALLERVWDMAAPAGGNALEAQVSRLREALGDDRRHPARILTARGVGYLYARKARDVHLLDPYRSPER